MTALRIVIAGVAVATLLSVLLSILRSLVLPRGVPSRIARVSGLAVRAVLSLRLALSRRRHDYDTRDGVLALEGPLSIFSQLLAWALSLYVCFSALFWSLAEVGPASRSVPRALERGGSSMLTLGTDEPHGLGPQLLGFAAAGIGLVLLALVITYLPTLYAAFSRREALISKLVVRAGAPPTGVGLLGRTQQLGRFDELEEVWGSWEDWFIEVGESHTTFPLLAFFRSAHPGNHWVLASEAVLDGASLVMTTCDVPRQSRSELCIEAGVQALELIAGFLGMRGAEPGDELESALQRATFDAGCELLAESGVPLRADRERAWADFRRCRARYEPLLTGLGRFTEAPRSEWSSWSRQTPVHRPPLVRIHGG